jgi:hypothetical protein
MSLRTPPGIFFTVWSLTALGLLLRLAAARGDLWLDEIWSLGNLTHLHNVGEIFWGLPSSNNHLLNSLWLWIVSPHASPVLIRLQSIVVGTLTIPVAAKFCGRRGPAAAVAGAALAASALVFVQYGSEARGYAGLLLMIFVAAEALENFLERPTLGARLGFAGAVAIGALFHLTMLMAAFTLVVATLIRMRANGQTPREIMTAALDLAIASALGALPALALLGLSVLNTHLLLTGVLTPFSLSRLAHGLTTLYAATLGLPFDLPLPLAAGLCAALTAAAAAYVGRERAILPLTCLLLVPIIATLLQAANVQYARYDLIGVLGLVAFLSDVAAKMQSEKRYIMIACLGLLVVLGNSVHVEQLIVLGRGNIEALAARMSRDGAATFASNMPVETWVSLHFYDRHGALTEIEPKDWCAHPPDWFVLTDWPAEESAVGTFGPLECRGRYDADMIVKAAPLSGLRLALYRRAAH